MPLKFPLVSKINLTDASGAQWKGEGGLKQASALFSTVSALLQQFCTSQGHDNNVARPLTGCLHHAHITVGQHGAEK